MEINDSKSFKEFLEFYTRTTFYHHSDHEYLKSFFKDHEFKLENIQKEMNRISDYRKIFLPGESLESEIVLESLDNSFSRLAGILVTFEDSLS